MLSRCRPCCCSGSLVGDYGPRFVFMLTAVFPLLVSAAAIAIPEERIVKPPGVMARAGSTSSRSSSPTGGIGGGSGGSGGGVAESFKQQASLLWRTAEQPAILLPAVFVFLWQATPSADTALLFFETNKLGFTPEVLGRIR